jgi:predicted aconitase with swiveling domain
MDMLIISAPADGPVLVCSEGLSFWGGVNAATGAIQDAHHPQNGRGMAGCILMMPTSRGSCSGSGVLLELAMNGHAPAALVFREPEDILTLGAFIAARMFDHPVAVLRLSPGSYDRLAAQKNARLDGQHLIAGDLSLDLRPLDPGTLSLTAEDCAMLDGAQGKAVQLAMQAILTMGVIQEAERLWNAPTEVL